MNIASPLRHRHRKIMLNSPSLLVPFFLAIMLWAQPASALNPTLSLDQLHHDIWTVKQGAPGEITTMAQTADGWIWLGTTFGLYRFDGVRFDELRLPAGEALLTRSVSNLFAAPDGSLLIGYFGTGLSLYRHGHITHYPALPNGRAIGSSYNTAVDTDGSIWAATSTGLAHFIRNAWQPVGAESGFPDSKATNVILDQYGVIWAADGTRLYRWERAQQRFIATDVMGDAAALVLSPDGRLWMDDRTTVRLVPQVHTGASKPRPADFNRTTGQSVGLFDRDGNYWATSCPIGICRSVRLAERTEPLLRPNAAPRERFDQVWQMSSLSATALLEDREGNIWVGTQAGLERFRNNKFAVSKSVAGERAYSLARDAAGQVWAMGWPGAALWRLADDGPPMSEPGKTHGLANYIASASDGALLLAGPRSIERRGPDRSESVALPEGGGLAANRQVVRLADDGIGLWADISDIGTFRRIGQQWLAAPSLGVPERVSFSARGGKGQMWFSYRDNRLISFDNGRTTTFKAADGIDVGRIRFIHAQQGEVLVAGEDGLVVRAGQRFRRLRAADASVLTGISGAVITADGDHWFNGHRGVVHVTARGWRAALDRADGMLAYELLDTLDGYPGQAAVLRNIPTALEGKPGQLWFVGTEGIARLDTGQLQRNHVPPPVVIDSLITEHGRVPSGPGVTLASGTANFRIEYSALSYTMPERVRFRYRLFGIDPDWQDAATRRVAYYTNVGPGVYRFQVQAVNEDGVWSTSDAVLRFRIEPTFSQTGWFTALCALLGGALVYLLYAWRLRLASQRICERLQDRLHERERIARTLHDTFLQSVQGLVLRFQSVLSRLPADAEARFQLNDILHDADSVMREGRHEVVGLRSGRQPDKSLPGSLGATGAAFAAIYQSEFHLTELGIRRAIAASVNTELEQIAREALFNAFRHAGGSRIELEFQYGDVALMVAVRDNGRGIGEAHLAAGHVAGHWGLTGMRERATDIGATLTLHNLPQRGAEVILILAARLAYAVPAPQPWLRSIVRRLRSPR